MSVAVLFAACSSTKPVESTITATTYQLATEIPAVTISAESEPQEPSHPWTDEELEAVALTLAGECYEDKTQDKRLVCEVILNRVSHADFADSVIEVLTAPHQFDGYWTQSRPISENDYAVAEQALSDWYENGCEALSEYLFFEAGSNRENVFRSEFK